MQVELKHLLREVGITAIFVTHDQEEALVVSDRIAVMDAGRIEQLADPVTLYSRPASLYVLEFVGRSTRLFGRVSASGAGEVLVDTAFGPLRGRGNFMTGSPVVVAVRPEAMRIGQQAANAFTARIADVSFLGSRTQVELAASAADGEDRLLVELARLPDGGLVPGASVTIGFDTQDALVFPRPWPIRRGLDRLAQADGPVRTRGWHRDGNRRDPAPVSIRCWRHAARALQARSERRAWPMD